MTPKTILIADDEPQLSYMLGEMLLNTLPNDIALSVETATDGLKAFEYMQVNCIDLLITDIQMPNMNGLELINSVKTLSNNMPIIAISANQELLQKAATEGATKIFLKPIDLKIFVKYIWDSFSTHN